MEGTREGKREKGNTEAQRTRRGAPRSNRTRSTGDSLPKQPGSLREIHYRNCQDLCGRSTTETARIFLCTFAFISPLRFELASNLEEGIEDRFADVVEFRLKMIDEFMQPFIHDLFDV